MHRDNQEAIARMNGLQPLVMMLSASGTPEMQAMAALALAAICRDNPDNQGAVADLGAITQLVALIRTGTPEVKAEVAGALWSLADQQMPNKVAIASAGGVAPLIMLLATGGARGQQLATRALLALGHVAHVPLLGLAAPAAPVREADPIEPSLLLLLSLLFLRREAIRREATRWHPRRAGGRNRRN